MTKNTTLKLCVIVITMLFSLCTQAQKKWSKTKPTTLTSIVEELKLPIYKTGVNKVKDLNNGFVIFVKLTDKKLPEFIVKDKKGNIITSYFTKKNSITCWRCFKDNKTGQRHCVEITCPNPDTMIPWDAIKANKQTQPVVKS
jgi:hypothetical protein